MLQSCEHNLFRRLLNLSSEENLVQYSIHLPAVSAQCSAFSFICPTSTHLVKVENQVQLTDIAEKLIQHFHEEVYRFEIGEFIVVGVYARAEE